METSNVTLTQSMSANGSVNADEESNGSLGSNLTDRCIDHSDDLSCGRVWMRKSCRGGRGSDEKSILMPNGGSLSVSERVGEAWIRELPKHQLRGELVVDGVVGG